ncbi:hypothetical protein [Bacillus sp. FJAT-52991]|uniref:Uncharacterized protein n=1 Tax=Bacillus kandeliae TaxID=3129297 RepID=A0ABZ2NA68_9BACI
MSQITIESAVMELEEFLDDVCLSGCHLIPSYRMDHMKSLASSCHELGLQLAEQTLHKMIDEIAKKNNQLQFDYEAFIHHYFTLSGYVEIIKTKL